MREVDAADHAASQPEAYEVPEEDEIKPTRPSRKDIEAFEEPEAEVEDLLGPSILAKLAEGLDAAEAEEIK
jgi:hypothetical protein